MKHTAIILAMVLLCTAASAQTALYKRYANRSDLRVYCVERYPLVGGDTVTVTFFEADNDSVRKVIQQELMALDPDRTQKQKSSKIETTPLSEEAREAFERAKKHKYLVSFLTNPVPGDGGRYSVNCPSDRPVILVFHIYSDEQHHNVTSHISSTEFDTAK